MRRRFWGIFTPFGLGTLLLLTACATSQPPKRPVDLPFSRVYVGTYDTVWTAAIKVLDIYSITVANREAGQLHTEWSDFRHNREMYDHPEQSDALEEVKYRLKLKLSKAVVTQTGEPAVRVQVLKELLEYKNIQTDWIRVPSDTFEENVILYRIGQRIRIAEVLKRKAQQKARAEAAQRKQKEGADPATPPASTPPPPPADLNADEAQ